MSTSVLYRAIGMSGYEHVSAWEQQGVFKLRMRTPEGRLRCPDCGSVDVIRRGTVDRLLHAPPVGSRATVLFVQTPRVECRACRRVCTATLRNVVPGKNHTRSFARLASDLRKMMTIQDVAH